MPPRSAIGDILPACFIEHYLKCTFIIDCTGVQMEAPMHPEVQRYLYSRYKGSYALKWLIAILTNGLDIVCSQGLWQQTFRLFHHKRFGISVACWARRCCDVRQGVSCHKDNNGRRQSCSCNASPQCQRREAIKARHGADTNTSVIQAPKTTFVPKVIRIFKWPLSFVVPDRTNKGHLNCVYSDWSLIPCLGK